MNVGVVDYDCGNLLSVTRAITSLGYACGLASKSSELAAYDAVILPGVGAFNNGMSMLNELGFAQELKTLSQQGKPILGICLGMQMLFDLGEEFGETSGLGLIPGRVKMINRQDGLKIPNIGWHAVKPNSRSTEQYNALISPNFQPGVQYYHVHSYCAVPKDPNSILAWTKYGNEPLVTLVAKDSVIGCQFHPEKSGDQGLLFIKNFLEFASTH